jgi:hypothetical protein
MFIFAPLVLVACGGKDDPATTDTGSTGDVCPNSIIEQFPENGSADAYYRTSIEFSLAQAETGTSITVTDAGGAEVAGATSESGSRVVFTPSGPLAPSTTYDVQFDWACGPTMTQFSTSAVGTPVSDTSVVEGSTYNLDLSSGRWVLPAGVGSLIETLIPSDLEVFFMVDSLAGDDMFFMGALGDGAGNQDMCSESIALPDPANFTENPFFSLPSDQLTLDVEGIPVVIEDMLLSGAFASDGSSIEGAVLAGTMDTRLLVDLVAEGGGDDAVCEIVEAFSVSCEECSDGSGPYCLSVFVDSLTAELRSGLVVVERTADDIAADPACGGGTQ